MDKGSSPTQTSGTTNTTSKPKYNPRVLQLMGQEHDLVKNMLFPMEERLQFQQRQLLNPLNGPSPEHQAQISSAQNYANQVGQYMPESMESSGFVSDLPAVTMLDLRNQAPHILAKINRSLIDPRFAALLGPMGQDTTQTTNSSSSGGGPSTGSQVMSGIGTAAAVAGTVAMIA